MDHDLSKLRPVHRKMYQEFVSSIYTPDEVPDELYLAYLKLAEIPEKDWGKPSTLEAVQVSQRSDPAILD